MYTCSDVVQLEARDHQLLERSSSKELIVTKELIALHFVSNYFPIWKEDESLSQCGLKNLQLLKLETFFSIKQMSDQNSRENKRKINKLGRFNSQRSEISFHSTISYGPHGIFNGANHLMIKLMFGTFIGFIFALVIFLEIENRHPSAENLNFKLARQAKRMFTDKKKLWEIYQSQLKTLNDHE